MLGRLLDLLPFVLNRCGWNVEVGVGAGWNRRRVESKLACGECSTSAPVLGCVPLKLSLNGPASRSRIRRFLRSGLAGSKTRVVAYVSHDLPPWGAVGVLPEAWRMSPRLLRSGFSVATACLRDHLRKVRHACPPRGATSGAVPLGFAFKVEGGGTAGVTVPHSRLVFFAAACAP